MKRILFGSVPVILVTLCSCSSNDALPGTRDEEVVDKIQVMIAPMEGEETSSRLMANDDVSSYLWELNDTIGIFPTKGGQVEFVIDESGAGGTFANFDGGGWGLKTAYNYSAYYPYNFYNRDAKAVPISYLGQIYDAQAEKERAHLRDYMFCACAPISTDGKLLSFNLAHLGNLMKLTLTLPEATSYTSFAVYTDAKVLPVKKNINLQTGTVTETVTELSDRLTVELKNVTTTKANEEVVVWIAFPSVSEAEHPLKVVVYDRYGFAYVANILNAQGAQAYASFTANKWQRRFAAPVLGDGFQSGISGWESDGTDYGGTVG